MMRIQFLSGILSILVLFGIAADLGIGCIQQAELEPMELCGQDSEQESQNPTKKASEIVDEQYRPEDSLPGFLPLNDNAHLSRQLLLPDACLRCSLAALPTRTPPPEQA